MSALISSFDHVQTLFPNQLLAIMNPSVLVIGNDKFLTALVRWDEQFLSSNLIVPDSETNLISILQKQQPKVVVIQASYPLDFQCYNDLKSQADLAWLYWIVLEENCLPELTYNDHLQLEIRALELGADAYLHLDSITQFQPELIDSHQKLLKIHIELGLSKSKIYSELVETNDFLSAIALADALTELNNRRALEWELPRQIQSSFNQNNPLSLIILDIDFFKSVNDSHGHLVGDRVLQLLSARLQNHLRLQDTIFRYGGEEFVILLKNTELTIGVKVAERLRKIIEEQPFKIDRNLTLPITISMGVSQLQEGDDPDGMTLLYRADQNLLRAKNSGRNQVVG